MLDSTLENLSLENAEAATLLTVLDSEQVALINASLEELLPLSRAKESSLAKLASMVAVRHANMAALGFAFSDEGVQAWIADWSAADKTGKASTSANALWRELLRNTIAAKECNRVNGLLITRHATNTNLALQSLNASRRVNEVYGPDGQTKTKLPSRTLVVG